MNFLLLPISFLYQGVLTLRHKLYDWHVLKSEKFDLPVICVGNLCLGGTGKTPHTEYLVRLLKDDYRVALLSRGYGRKTKGFRMADDHCGADDIGDEPMQFHRLFPDVTVAVDENRAEGIRQLLAMPNPPQVILLDDAMQHRRIQAGLTILLTEYGQLYCDDFLVPTGTLRDVKSAAKKADLIVVSKAPHTISESQRSEIVKKLRPLPHQKVLFSSLHYEVLKAANQQARSFESNKADAALLFSGIANPKPLIDEMNRRFPVLEAVTFPDHHPFSEKDIQNLLTKYENLPGERKIVITTEKDYARLEKNPYLCQFDSVPLFSAPIKVCFHEEELINKIIRDYVRKNV